MDYKRFISYLYRYQGDEKSVNVGYIRCEQRQGCIRLTVSLNDKQGVEDGRYKVYLYKCMEDGLPVGYIVDEVILKNHAAELRLQSSGHNVWNTGKRIEEFDGMILRYDTEHAYMTQWTDHVATLSRFVTWQDYTERKRKKEESVEIAAEITPVQSHIDAAAQKEAMPRQEEPAPEGQASAKQEPADNEPLKSANDMRKTETEPERKPISSLTLKLMDERPKLPDFENHEIYDCVRIIPNDIGMLEMENWRLGVNSFLTHGYYNYKYLLLGKLRFQDGVVKAVLGVPGVYDNKEQYIAKIFGFEVFVPLKHTNIKTGSFGYWITELV